MTEMTQEVKDAVVVGKLGGKDIQFVRTGRVARLRLSGGGKLPDVLDGGWTDIKNAKTAVDSYIAKAEAKVAEALRLKEEKPLTAAQKRAAKKEEQ